MSATQEPAQTDEQKKDSPLSKETLAPSFQEKTEETKQETSEQKAEPPVEKAEPDAIEILDAKVDPKRWVIGKPPEHGGKETEYSIYVQRKLGWMARMRFFSLVGDTLANAVKAGGVLNMGMSDIFGPGGGSVRQRMQQLTEQDFADAASFVALAAQLVAYSPDFLLDCYCIWLDVPMSERPWAKLVMDQPWEPSAEKWGLKEDEGMEMIEYFIDQNYEEIRSFFVQKLPALARRVSQKEQDHASRSDQSKQSKLSA